MSVANGGESMQGELTDEGSESVALMVREELARRRLSRQWLADEAKVSLSTLEKALAGRRPFTLATVVRLEDALGTNLRSPAQRGQTGLKLFAPESMGAYARPAVQWLEGTYLTLRPSFGEQGAIFAYLTSIAWDDARAYDRGKVLSAEDLDAGKMYGRYEDVDGDGIPWRTLPGTHASKGAFFTRGTSRNAQARYSEAGSDYVYNMERLRQKFETAKGLVPAPEITPAATPTRLGVIYYGSTSPAMREALTLLASAGVQLDALRVRGFPFNAEVEAFVDGHDAVFVVEQNESAQLRTLLVNECEFDPKKLVKVLHYDGSPITARFIAGAIAEAMNTPRLRPLAPTKG